MGDLLPGLLLIGAGIFFAWLGVRRLRRGRATGDEISDDLPAASGDLAGDLAFGGLMFLQRWPKLFFTLMAGLALVCIVVGVTLLI